MSAEAEQPLRAVVVDDEEPARALLREYLATIPGVEILAECADGFAAVKAVVEHAPDLLLLDVQMPKLSGFEVLELLPAEATPAVIFSTAYDEYALRAFEVRAVDYLLKPFARERLVEAVVRVRERRASGRAEPAAGLARDLAVEGRWQRVLVREGSRIHVLPVDRIDYAEARGDYVLFKAGEEEHAKQVTLSQVEAGLDPARFIRIHRSFVLNLDRLARLELYAKDSRVAILRDGTRLPVSRAGYARLRELL